MKTLAMCSFVSLVLGGMSGNVTDWGDSWKKPNIFGSGLQNDNSRNIYIVIEKLREDAQELGLSDKDLLTRVELRLRPGSTEKALRIRSQALRSL